MTAQSVGSIRNLVSRSPFGVARNVGISDYRAHYGVLTSPRNGKSLSDAQFLGVPWAADNDAYAFWSRKQAYNPAPLLRALPRWTPFKDTCLFVVAPDILTNAKATLEVFWYWQPIIKAYGFPVAFVVQDGIEAYPPPWEYLDALFIGGTNKTKYSRHVAELVKEAKGRGKYVHVGRINSVHAIRYCQLIGADSFDGTNFTRDMQRETLKTLPHQKQVLQPFLFSKDIMEAVG